MTSKTKWTKRQHTIRKHMLRLDKAWRKLPGQRLGQLICNAQNACDGDLFYLDDETLLRLVERYIDPA